MQRHRRTETDLSPVFGHRFDLLGAGALAPLIEIEGRHFLFQKSHASRLERTGIRLRLSWPEEQDKLADTTRQPETECDEEPRPAVQ